MRPVIDANVLMHGRRNYDFDKASTVPEVMDELESSDSRLKADTLDLDVRRPSDEPQEKVQEKVDETFAKVSEADKALVALALDIGEKLITDDKDLQNLASHLDVSFEAFMGEEIDEELEWVKTCGNCGKTISSPPCPRCGSVQVRRRLDQCS
jgi:rRNA maturation endonuclease Nob1